MPVEIREIVIRTEIATGHRNGDTGMDEKELKTLKKQLLDECNRIIAARTKKNYYKR